MSETSSPAPSPAAERARAWATWGAVAWALLLLAAGVAVATGHVPLSDRLDAARPFRAR